MFENRQSSRNDKIDSYE